MPNLNKIKEKSKKLKKTKKLTNLPLPLKKTQVKSSPTDYYNCLLLKAHNDWVDPTTGKKTKITACCRDCKMNAPKVNQIRNQEISQLIIAYHQVGESLKKLLKPLK